MLLQLLPIRLLLQQSIELLLFIALIRLLFSDLLFEFAQCLLVNGFYLLNFRLQNPLIVGLDLNFLLLNCSDKLILILPCSLLFELLHLVLQSLVVDSAKLVLELVLDLALNLRQEVSEDFVHFL